MGAPFFSAAGRGEREGLGVSAGLGTGLSSGVAVGVGDAFLRFDFVFDVGLGVGVGEIFFRFGVAVGEGVGDVFLVECLLCLCVGAGVGVGSKIFLILGPNDSSDALIAWNVLSNIATISSHLIESKSPLYAVVPSAEIPTGCHSERSRGISDLLYSRWRGQRCLHFGRHDTMQAPEGLLC